ncbi:uncharacterized protein LOC126790987 isoform X2 [Argentina anserina]|uniref:uncharacterized protein LOC126790987 isoform X2 n=1 Tax=Argentina anserina TaxID=57926 RepID=UPI0021763A49|nr:uncharacterized protein LOC126790987 [Potentilla anserina]
MEAKKEKDKKQKCMKKEDDGGKYLQWNPEMDSRLADILKSERQQSHKGDGGWKSEAFTSAVLKMSTIYNIHVMKDNVKNHLKGWKRTCGVVSDILSQSDFNWDSGRKIITVDDNNVWSEYAKTHPETSKYRFKTLVNWDDIVDLCAKDRATGYGAENAENAMNFFSGILLS